jgi:hypothetical protein
MDLEIFKRTLKEQVEELKENMDNPEALLSKKDVAEELGIDNISDAGHKTFMLGILFGLEALLEEIEKGGE